MKFWQIAASILIFRLFTEISDSTYEFRSEISETILALLIWLLLSAIIWKVSELVFRAVDARNGG